MATDNHRMPRQDKILPYASPVRKNPLLSLRPEGLYCEAGDFYIDPWRPVNRAVITHAHADHARAGHQLYLAETSCGHFLRGRLGAGIHLLPLHYGEKLRHRGVTLSLHPAGHIPGSAQVRVEYRGEIWVAGGDYKVGADPLAAAFEPVRCHTFITECTFGLPIYRWPDPGTVAQQISGWWQECQQNGQKAILFAYSLGKAQRLLALLPKNAGPIYAHPATARMNAIARRSGYPLPTTDPWPTEARKAPAEGLYLVPPAIEDSQWLRQCGSHSKAMASGWMTVRGNRRRRALDRGFVISDHADWSGLIEAIAATGAENVLATHGQTHALVRWLREKGYRADNLQTPFGEEDEG
ncbi:MAG: ligase-associated DNA damage response exonuclease [Opitutales bacterium]|nr:ligase-associated DNA damage response exonuclease [Opitutales bacterium]